MEKIKSLSETSSDFYDLFFYIYNRVNSMSFRVERVKYYVDLGFSMPPANAHRDFHWAKWRENRSKYWHLEYRGKKYIIVELTRGVITLYEDAFKLIFKPEYYEALKIAKKIFEVDFPVIISDSCNVDVVNAEERRGAYGISIERPPREDEPANSQ